MRPSAMLLLLAVATAAGTLLAEGTTPAAKFWEQALPGSPMPEAIAVLVQKGIDHTPLAENNTAAAYIGQAQWSCSITLKYSYNCNGKEVAPGNAAATGVFFLEEEARVGSTMTVYLPEAGELPGILPRDAAARAPFGDLAAVLARFGIAPGSDQAAGVEGTLRWCRDPPLRGEQKACATSLEATVGAATRMLLAAPGRRAVWAAGSALPLAGLPRQEYEVTAVAALDGDHHVACHNVPFPYAVYQCHMTAPSSSRAFVVTLRGLHRAQGPEVAMAAICHLDTSGWDPEHPAFKALHTKPGGVPVCHFMPYAHLVFGEKADQP